MKNEPIMAYPNPAYSLDFPNQLRMDQLISQRTRLTLSLFLSGFTAAVLFAVTGWQPMGLATLPLLFAGAFVWMRRTPSLRCTSCRQRMQCEYVSCGTDDEEFLVCKQCRRYTFNRRRRIL